MNFKKFISSISALAIASSAFAGMAVTANAAEPVTVLDETFLSKTLTSGTNYTWSEDVASMLVAKDDMIAEDKETDPKTTKMNFSGLFLSNLNNASRNYDNKKIVTFTKPVGDASNSVDISYQVTPQQDKGQAATYYTVSFYNEKNELIFAIKEANGPSYGFSEALIYADSATTTKEVALTNAMAKSTSKDRRASISFNSTGGNLTVDGNTYPFTASVAGISYITASVSGGQDYTRGTFVTNLKLTTTEQTEKKAIVTVNSYDKADNSLIRTSTLEAVVGKTYTATDAQTATFTAANGKKYNYHAEGSTASVEVTDTGTVLSLYFDEAPHYTCTVAAIGDVTKTLSTVEVYKDDTFTYTYPQYIVENGVAYEAAKNTEQNVYYGGSVEKVTEAKTVDVTYKTAYKNVVFYEDLDKTADENAGVRASNGLAYTNTEYTSTKNIEPGTYTVVIKRLDKGRGSSLTIGDVPVYTYDGKTTGSWSDITIKDVKVETAAPITWNAGGSNTRDCLDTILVIEQKTHPEAFTFTKTANEIGTDAKVKITFQNNDKKTTYDHTADLGTTVAGEGTATIAVIVTNIADGYSVQSITIE